MTEAEKRLKPNNWCLEWAEIQAVGHIVSGEAIIASLENIEFTPEDLISCYETKIHTYDISRK